MSNTLLPVISGYHSLHQIVESIYGMCNSRLVGPFSFMENMALYTTTSSRYATEVLGKTVPCGLYTTLQRTLNDTFTAEASKVPSGDCVAVFDNEQVIGRKSGVQPNQKVRCSVITNLAFVELETDSQLQHIKDLKPKNWFKLDGFEARLEALRGEELKKTQSNKEDFLKVADQIASQNTPYDESLERAHYSQVYNFVDAALQDVISEQKKM